MKVKNPNAPVVKREAEEDWGFATLDKVKEQKPPAVILGRCLLLSGFVCLVIAVFTHIAEKLQVFPGMGWGLPDSPGHYLDLVSALLGSMLLIAGMIWISFNARRSR